MYMPFLHWKIVQPCLYILIENIFNMKMQSGEQEQVFHVDLTPCVSPRSTTIF